MPETNCADVDVVKELRLRRWARVNYVPADQRSHGWHPVVLDEMRSKDDELEVRSQEGPIRLSYVPLPPTNVYILHPAELEDREPKLFGLDESQSSGRSAWKGRPTTH
jgi:hypothetical protein